jgi:hypothetical protein
MLITLFDQDCVVIGGCHIWGWIKMLMFAFALIVSTAVTVYVARVMKKEKDTTAESA